MSRRHRFVITVPSAFTVAALACSGAALGGDLPGRVEQRTFRASEPDRLAALEIVSGGEDIDGRSAPMRRTPVSDVAVRIAPADPAMPIAVALTIGDGDVRGRALLSAELLIVAGGRLVIEAGLLCGPWQAAATLCRLACNGGTVALVRTLSRRTVSLAFVAGPVVAGESSARLGACQGSDAGVDMQLVTRGGEPLEIGLAEERASVPAAGRRR